jgi:hypothetical protein
MSALNKERVIEINAKMILNRDCNTLTEIKHHMQIASLRK